MNNSEQEIHKNILLRPPHEQKRKGLALNLDSLLIYTPTEKIYTNIFHQGTKRSISKQTDASDIIEVQSLLLLLAESFCTLHSTCEPCFGLGGKGLALNLDSLFNHIPAMADMFTKSTEVAT